MAIDWVRLIKAERELVALVLSIYEKAQHHFSVYDEIAIVNQCNEVLEARKSIGMEGKVDGRTDGTRILPSTDTGSDQI